MENMKKNLKLTAALYALLLIGSINAYSESVGVVSYLEGRVDIQKAGSNEFIPLRESELISEGDSVRTKSKAKAEIIFDDKSILRLAENTKITVNDFVLDEKNRRETADIMLERGKTRTIIAKMKDHADFKLSTPNAKGSVKGSEVYSFYTAGNSGMLVTEGTLSIVNPQFPDKTFVVPAGKSILIPQDNEPRQPRTFLEFEKKMYEKDTSVPVTSVARRKDTVIRGSVAKMIGDVKITKIGKTKEQPLSINDTILEGDRIRTGENGIVKIMFDNGNSISLKPDSRIFIRTLVINPDTGEYENIFESDQGKIRSVVQKLKGKSTFKIKTPAAVCGVRGTVMYLDISATSVKAFFEGGYGTIENVVSGLETSVQAGYNAFATKQGQNSQPAPTSGQERVDWGSGWDGGGVEGYSTPEGGSVGVTFSGDDSGGITGSSVIPGGLIGDGSSTPEDVPIDPVIPPTPPIPVEIPTTANVIMDSEIYSFEGSGGSLTSALTATTDTFWDNGTAQLLSAGPFSYEGSSNFIWGSTESDPINFYSMNPETNTYTTYDGGSFFGVTSGIGFDPTDNYSNWLLDGMTRVLYIDPFGNAGIAGADMSGNTTNGDTAYIMGGLLNGTEYTNTTGVTAEQLVDSLYLTEGDGILFGFFGDNLRNGYIEGEDYFRTLSIANHETYSTEDWGMYYQNFHGTFYDNTRESLPWSGVMGGEDAFGAYVYDDDGELYFENDYGIWIATLENGIWVSREDDPETEEARSGVLSAMLAGRFITATKMGYLTGDMLGISLYDVYTETEGSTYYWEAVGSGVWQGTPLTFSGMVGEYGDNCLFFNDEGYPERTGGDYGIIGASRSPWFESADVLAMGGYWIDNDYNSDLLNSTLSKNITYLDSVQDQKLTSGKFDTEAGGVLIRSGYSYLWNTALNSYNAYDNTYTTIDGGAFFGFANGLWINDSINAGAVLLYIDPYGNLGYIMGNLYGAFYSSLENVNYSDGLWETDGVFSPRVMNVLGDISPENVEEYEAAYEMDVYSEYDSEGNREDQISYDGGTSFFEGRSWGIYNILLGGGREQIGDFESDEVFGTMINGEGVFGYEDSLGVLSGDVYGLFDGDYWIAGSVGTWESYENFDEYNEDYGSYRGFFGGVLLDNGSMVGRMMALYSQGNEALNDIYLEERYLEVVESDPFDMPEMNLFIDNFEGTSLQFSESDWGIFGFRANGEIYNSNPLFTSIYGGTSYSDDFDGMLNGVGYVEDGGYWIILQVGCNDPATGLMRGPFRGLYASQDMYRWSGGIIKGKFFGYEVDSESFDGVGVGEFANLARNYEDDIYKGDVRLLGAVEGSEYSFEDFLESIQIHDIQAIGRGSFIDGGFFNADSINGAVMNFNEQSWGIWSAMFEGECSQASSMFRMATALQAEDGSQHYVLGTLGGVNEDSALSGTFQGLLIYPAEDESGNLALATMDADAVGYVEVDEEGAGSWEAVAAGEWVEVTDLLDTSTVFGPEGLNSLNDFVSVPITEAHQSLMTGVGAFEAGGIMSAVMDLSVYTANSALMDDLWIAQIRGEYDGPTSDNWVVNVNQGNDSVTLNGQSWNDGEWVADVSGNVNGSDITGQSGGTYADDGTFEGAGAGTVGSTD